VFLFFFGVFLLILRSLSVQGIKSSEDTDLLLNCFVVFLQPLRVNGVKVYTENVDKRQVIMDLQIR